MKCQDGKTMLSMFLELLKGAWGLEDPKRSIRIKVGIPNKSNMLYFIYNANKPKPKTKH